MRDRVTIGIMIPFDKRSLVINAIKNQLGSVAVFSQKVMRVVDGNSILSIYLSGDQASVSEALRNIRKVTTVIKEWDITENTVNVPSRKRQPVLPDDRRLR